MFTPLKKIINFCFNSKLNKFDRSISKLYVIPKALFSLTGFTKRIFTLLIICFISINLFARVLHKDFKKPGHKPEWTFTQIKDEDKFVYISGFGENDKEDKAMEIALQNCSAIFAKKAKLSLEDLFTKTVGFLKEKSIPAFSKQLAAEKFSKIAVPVDFYTTKKNKIVQTWVLLKLAKDDYNALLNNKR